MIAMARAGPLSLHMLADEGHHALEHVAGLRQVRRAAGMLAALKIFERDLAAGFAVRRDETLRLVAGEVGLQVLVIVHRIAARLEPDRSGELYLFAALEHEHRAALRHIGLALPVVFLARASGLRPLRWVARRNQPLGVAVAAEWIDHRPRHHHASSACVVG